MRRRRLATGGRGRLAAALVAAAAMTPAVAAGQEPDSRTRTGGEVAAPGELPGSTRELAGPAGALRVLDTGIPEATRAPDGPAAPTPVIFVHSLAGSLEQWAPQLRRLAGARRAVALDLRGHGGSASPVRADYTVLALAGDVRAVADSLGLERYALVGHSLGGGVIAAVAALDPDRVAGLLFVDPVGDQRQVREEVVQFLFELDRDYRATVSGYWDSILEGASEPTRSLVLRDLEATGPAAVMGSLEGLLHFDPAALLGSWRGPMLSVVTPQNDLPFSLHNAVPNLDAVTVEGTSHWVHLDAPDAFGRILDRFLARVDGTLPEAGAPHR